MLWGSFLHLLTWCRMCSVRCAVSLPLAMLPLRFVVFPYKPPEHTFIVDCHFWQAVPVKEQKFCVALQNNRLCIFPFVQHPLKCFQHFFTHRNNPVTAFRLRRFHIVTVLLLVKISNHKTYCSYQQKEPITTRKYPHVLSALRLCVWLFDN